MRIRRDAMRHNATRRDELRWDKNRRDELGKRLYNSCCITSPRINMQIYTYSLDWNILMEYIVHRSPGLGRCRCCCCFRLFVSRLSLKHQEQDFRHRLTVDCSPGHTAERHIATRSDTQWLLLADPRCRSHIVLIVNWLFFQILHETKDL